VVPSANKENTPFSCKKQLSFQQIMQQDSHTKLRKSPLKNYACNRSPGCGQPLSSQIYIQNSTVKKDYDSERTHSHSGHSSGEHDDEDVIVIDESTLTAIVKVQACIRGYLTRKMIFEYCQQLQLYEDQEQPQYVLRASDPNRFSQPLVEEGLLGEEQPDLPPEDMQAGRFEYASGIVYEG
jgi:hypothetical protein